MNYAKTALLLAALTAIFVAMGALVGGRPGLIFAFFIALIMNAISLWKSDTMVLKMFKALEVDPKSAPELHEMVGTLAGRAGLPMPRIYIMNAPQPNAFATGWNRNAALVAVSTGLISSMSRDEIEAVLAHEISHVANGDMVTLTLIQGVVNTFVIFLSRVIAFVIDRVVFRVQRGHGPAFWIVSMVSQIILGIFASMIVMWFSRWREFRADAGASELMGRKQPMINALTRLQHMQSEGLPPSLQAMGINGGLGKMFSSHPPLEERIAALQSA